MKAQERAFVHQATEVIANAKALCEAARKLPLDRDMIERVERAELELLDLLSEVLAAFGVYEL